MATQLTLKAVDRSTYVVTASFTDENDEPVIPTEVFWTLTNGAAQIMNSREDVEITNLDSTVHFVLYGNDLKYSDGEFRRLVVEATYDSSLGTDLPLRGQAEFYVEDLTAV